MDRRLLSAKPTNPLLQGLYLVAGGMLLAVALVLGTVILAIVLGAALVVGVVLWVRLWWLGRKRHGLHGGAHGETRKGDVIEVEYTVVEKPDPNRRD